MMSLVYTCTYFHTCTIVPAEHYSITAYTVNVLCISQCVTSTLHFTPQKVPAEHYSILPTLYIVLIP